MSKVFVGIFFLIFVFCIFQVILGSMQSAFQRIDEMLHHEVVQISLDE